MTRIATVLLLSAATAAGIAAAEDRLNLDETTIFGNRELPRVTFVTPWRDVDIGMPEMPLSRSVTEPVAPLDREMLRRELEMRRQLEDRTASSGDAE